MPRQRSTYSVSSLSPRVRTASTARAALPPDLDRGFYRSPAWRSLVADLIRQRGRRCQCGCDYVGGVIIGDHVVEISDGGARLDPGNVMLLSPACHNRKTALARLARARGAASGNR
jgi:5-methylcytosine-specific restriction endonuclease McrA